MGGGLKTWASRPINEFTAGGNGRPFKPAAVFPSVHPSPGGGIGRRASLRSLSTQVGVGSSPIPGILRGLAEQSASPFLFRGDDSEVAASGTERRTLHGSIVWFTHVGNLLGHADEIRVCLPAGRSSRSCSQPAGLDAHHSWFLARRVRNRLLAGGTTKSPAREQRWTASSGCRSSGRGVRGC